VTYALGRDAVLQAVLSDLQRLRDELQSSEARVAARDAEIDALRVQYGLSGDAGGREHARVMELEASRAELRKIQSDAQRQPDLLHMKDVEIAALRTELHEMRETQLPTSKILEAGDRCKVLEVQVDRMQGELSLKASSANQADERCKALQLQLQRLESDLSANQAKLQEALNMRLTHADLGASHAEKRCKVLEAKVQQQQADLDKTTARCAELESMTEQPRTKGEISKDVGGLGIFAAGAWDGAEQTAKAIDLSASRAESPRGGTASVMLRPSTNSSARSARFRDEVRTARALSNAAPASSRYDELRQYRRLVMSSVADV